MGMDIIWMTYVLNMFEYMYGMYACIYVYRYFSIPSHHTISCFSRGHVLDLDQLTISPRLFSYRLCIHLTPLSDEGNLKDTCIAAVVRRVVCIGMGMGMEMCCGVCY
ncbi:hypothetical protein EON63_17035 [archaeon]|nr:MAG: hypothetical protein EON63_17035 [archaeon]